MREREISFFFFFYLFFFSFLSFFFGNFLGTLCPFVVVVVAVVAVGEKLADIYIHLRFFVVFIVSLQPDNHLYHMTLSSI